MQVASSPPEPMCNVFKDFGADVENLESTRYPISNKALKRRMVDNIFELQERWVGGSGKLTAPGKALRVNSDSAPVRSHVDCEPRSTLSSARSEAALVKTSVVSPPVRAPSLRSKSCPSCGKQISAAAGLCVCRLLDADPTRLVLEVLNVARMAPRTLSEPLVGGVAVKFPWPTLKDGEGFELRIAKITSLGRLEWPESFTVRLDSLEVVRKDVPKLGQHRGACPLDLKKHVGTPGSVVDMRLDARGGGAANVNEFVCCVVRTGRKKSANDLVVECMSRPVVPADKSRELITSLREAEDRSEKEGVECSSPWCQSLLCPLTRDRIRVPARGRLCAHLSCFDLEAYITISGSTIFHRRWLCPICGFQLPPRDIVVCGLTQQWLESSHATSVDLSSRGFLDSAREAAVQSPSKMRRWRCQALSPGTQPDLEEVSHVSSKRPTTASESNPVAPRPLLLQGSAAVWSCRLRRLPKGVPTVLD